MPLDEARRSQLDSIVAKMDEQGAPPDDIRAVVEDFKGKYDAPEKGGGVGGYLGAAAEGLIPEAIRHPSMIADVPGALLDVARENPMDLLVPGRMIGKDIGQASIDSFNAQRAKGTNLASSLAAGVPLIGPAAAQAGEEIGQGNYAEGLGHATAMLLPFAARGVNLGTRVGEAGAMARQAGATVRPVAAGAVRGALSEGWKALEGGNPLAAPPKLLGGAVRGGVAGAKALSEAKAAAAFEQAQRATIEGLGTKAELLPAEVSPLAEAPGLRTIGPAKAELLPSEVAPLPENVARSPKLSEKIKATPKAEAVAEKAAAKTPKLSDKVKAKVVKNVTEIAEKPSLKAPSGPVKAPPASEIKDLKGAQKLTEFVAHNLKSGSSVGQINDTLRQLYGMTAPEAAHVIRTTKTIYNIPTVKGSVLGGEFVPSSHVTETFSAPSKR